MYVDVRDLHPHPLGQVRTASSHMHSLLRTGRFRGELSQPHRLQPVLLAQSGTSAKHSNEVPVYKPECFVQDTTCRCEW